MTSVKELGETLRKRQAAVEGAEATEEAMLGAVGSAYAILLVVGGCLVLALGAFMACVGVVAPDLVWMAESLGRMGITSGAVLTAGLCLLGLGMIAKELAQAQRAMLSAVRRAGGAAALAEHQQEIREHLGKVHFALRVLQESTKSLLEAAHEHSYKREDAEQDDAVFRLAASLDQLGLRLEDRLDSQQSGIEQRLGSLDAALEATRRRICQWIEDLPRQFRTSGGEAAEEEPAQAKRRRKSRKGSREMHPAAPAAGPSRSEPDHGEDDEDEGELEILVTLEDRPERDEDSGQPRGSLSMFDVLDGFDEGLDADDEQPTTASFLFDPQLSARLDELGGLDGDEERGEPSADSAETREKLAQLQELLADSKLRRVLDELSDPWSGE